MHAVPKDNAPRWCSSARSREELLPLYPADEP